MSALPVPDVDDSTENDIPQPPLVTRWVEYHGPGIKIFAHTGGKFGDPPPYKWEILSFTDLKSGAVIDRDSALERLGLDLRPV